MGAKKINNDIPAHAGLSLLGKKILKKFINQRFRNNSTKQ